jgi:putative two-component system hydrogenase maturation factor HypX/HoxX
LTGYNRISAGNVLAKNHLCWRLLDKENSGWYPMKIVFLTTTHNSLSQRAFVELVDRGHRVIVVIASSEEVMLEAVEREHPDLIVAPMLKKVIPASIWQDYTCIIVHPGIKGDRGPSSLDWAILNGCEEWGVTLLQASAEMDAGDIWASRTFAMRDGSKSHLYRHEVTEAAIQGLLETIAKFESHTFVPEPLDYSRQDVKGRWQASMKQADRAIDWRDSTASVLRKIRCADSFPGVFDTVPGMQCYLYGAHEEGVLKGTPGEIIATRDGAICRATGDGAVWITHLKQKGTDGEAYFKLPATQVLGDRLTHVPEIPVAIDQPYDGRTYREIWYEERQAVGYLHFDFYNGAMSTDQCQRLREAFLLVRQRPTKVIVLMAGTDFWSNGIHLNTIEAAEDPAHESWRNIGAMNDLVRDIITTDSHLVIAALQGNAAAGGVILALAADYVYARKGIVLNPHYKSMGKLYGSEYWTYLLPKRVGEEKARELTEALLPISTSTAQRIGLLDDAFEVDVASFREHIRQLAEELASSHRYEQMLSEKRHTRKNDEAKKPLQAYREEELQQMWQNFFGADRSYHLARKHFVYKGLIPSGDRGLLDSAHQCAGDERCTPDGRAVVAAGHIAGWHDGYDGRASITAAILDGRAMSGEIKAQVRAEVRRFLEKQGQAPGLVIVRVGADAASGVYSQAILRLAEDVGINARHKQLAVNTSADELRSLLVQLNHDQAVHGMLVQMPLPAHLSQTMVSATIAASKDIDGISPYSAGNLFLGLPAFLPSTAAAVMAMLERTQTPLEGRQVVVISRSNVVGKPLALMLLQKHATVMICHSRTTHLATVTRQADVLIAAAGVARMVSAEMVKPGAIVIDVGMNVLSDGSIVGDVDVVSVREVAGAITPVPGGIGPLTNVVLLKQCVQAAWQLLSENTDMKTAA